MSGLRYYFRDGTPGSFEEVWARWPAEQRVALDQVAGFTVSTVWLAIDHSFGDGPPLIFETMVFHESSDYEDLEVRRYSTEAQARAGHDQVLANVQELVRSAARLTEEAPAGSDQ